MQVRARIDTELRCVMCRNRNIKGRQPWARSLAPSIGALSLLWLRWSQLCSEKI